MKRLIRDAINSHKEHISFHTPAHGGGMRFSGSFSSISEPIPQYSALDITELSYSGNLFSSQGVIAQSATHISRAYRTEHTFFVTAGATAAVHTAINALRDKRFLVLGTAHMSVFAALRLAKAHAYYSNSFEDMGALITKTQAEVVLVTSPDYLGKTLPLAEIVSNVKQKNAILIIDASHGSHFVFSSKLPVSATEYGDIVIHSLHKTLPVLTGGALLHCRKYLRDRVFAAFSDTHTTSPSYPTMLSIENAVWEFSQKGEMFYHLVLSEISKFVAALPPPFTRVESGDPTRLVIASPYDGGDVAAHLEKSEIFVETQWENCIVLIVTPYNCHFLQEVLNKINAMPALALYGGKKHYPRPKRLVRLKSFCNAEFVGIEQALGRKLFKEIGLYPPGTPLFFAGETLTAKKISFILQNANRMFGLDKDRLPVVK
ncbi:MAG: aminotransferase class I/II-fold pyridoxal phosphate-dependent enzyme [Clostridia bacterium]